MSVCLMVAMTAQPQLDPPTDYGLLSDGGNLQAIPTTLEPVPDATVQLVRCDCVIFN